MRKYIPELKRQADIIVVLSHCGYPVDQELAAQVPGITVIVGGHSHTKIAPARTGGPHHHCAGLGTRQGPGDLEPRVNDGKIVGFMGRLEEIGPRHREA